MVLVLLGVGGLFAGASIGLLGIGLAFAIAVIAMIYAIGPISGCHINPAVTIGVWAIKGINTKDAVMYVIFQIIGAIVAGAMLWLFITDLGSNTDFVADKFQAVSTFYEKAPADWSMALVFLVELVIAFILQIVVLGSLNNKSGSVNAGLAIGFTVAALIYLAGPFDNAGLNPIRDIGPAVFAGGKALEQLWLFIVAPIVGAVVGSFVWKWLGKADAA